MRVIKARRGSDRINGELAAAATRAVSDQTSSREAEARAVSATDHD